MRLIDLTSPELIFPGLRGKDPASALRALAASAVEAGVAADAESLFAKLWEREQLGSTGIGHGVAVPHCRLAGLERIVLAVGRAKKAVPFGALDKRPVQLFFLVIAPENQAAAYLECLREISLLAKDESRVARLAATSDAATLYRLLGEEPEAP